MSRHGAVYAGSQAALTARLMAHSYGIDFQINEIAPSGPAKQMRSAATFGRWKFKPIQQFGHLDSSLSCAQRVLVSRLKFDLWDKCYRRDGEANVDRSNLDVQHKESHRRVEMIQRGT